MTMHGKTMRTRWTVALTLAVAAGVLSGCDRGDEAAKAIEKAERQLNTYTVAGSMTHPDPAKRRAQLGEIAKAVKPYTDAKLAGQARAANLIGAQAAASLGEIDLADAEQAERELIGKVQAARQALEIWISQSSRAAAEEAFDPTAQLAELDEQIKALDAQIAAKNQAKAQLEQRLAGMTQEAEGKIAQAKTRRGEATAIQARVEGVTATEGLKLVEDAVKVRRAADALDTEASGIQAQVRIMQPEVDQLARDAAAYQRNRESLVQAKAALNDRQKQARDTAAEARQAAQQAAAQIDKLVAEAKDLRDGRLIAANDKAVKSYRDALTMVNKAVTAGGSDPGAKLSSALHQQSLGQALLGKARALDSSAGLMTLLANAKPALPKSEQFAAAAKDLRSQTDAVIGEVKEAFSKAWGVYETAKDAGQSGELFKSRMESATNTLKELAGEKPKTAAAAPAETVESAKPAVNDKPANSGNGAALSQADAEAAGKAFADAFHDALRKRDFNAMVGMTAFSNADRETFANMLSAQFKLKELDEVCREKLGKSVSELSAGADPAIKAMLGSSDQQIEQFKAQLDRTSADYTFAIEGTSIRMTAKRPSPTETPDLLINRNGRWLMEPSPESAGALRVMRAIAKPMGDLMDSLISDLKSGKIKDQQAFLTQLTVKMAALRGQMMKNMPNMPSMPEPDK